MSKPIHVSEELHKAVKVTASRRERPMKEIVSELLKGEAEGDLVDEIQREVKALKEKDVVEQEAGA
jgi:hypothetical protein